MDDNRAPGPGLAVGYSLGSMGWWSINSCPWALISLASVSPKGLSGSTEKVSGTLKAMNLCASPRS